MDKEKTDTQQPAQNTGGSKSDKVFKYRCKERCTYNGKFVREGEIIVLADKKDVPHFELVTE